MRQTEELRVAILAAVKASEGRPVRIPVIASVSVDELGRMADGTDAAEIGRRMQEWGADVIGVNCSDGPMNVLSAVEAMLGVGSRSSPRRTPACRGVSTSGWSTCRPPSTSASTRGGCSSSGCAIVGGCCGTTPEHVKRIAAAARMATASDHDEAAVLRRGDGSCGARRGEWLEARAVDAAPRASRAPTPQDQKSRFAAKLGKRFVVSVEVNPPVGLDPSRAVAAAKSLKAGGVDVVNIADGLAPRRA